MTMADGVKEFVEFGKRIKGYISGITSGRSIAVVGQPAEEFGKNVFESYNDSHLYMVEEETKYLLMLTKPPKDNRMLRLPFKNMFIGCHFTKAEIEKFFGTTIEYEEIFGLLLQEGKATFAGTDNNFSIELEDSSILHNVRVIACCEEQTPRGREIVFNTMHINMEFDKELDIATKIVDFSEAKHTKKFCKIFTMNLLNLIHDPEMEFVHRTRDDASNKKRESKGKLPIPASTVIRLTGKRKIYVDNLIAGNKFSYSHQFWVRGTYRHLKSERFKNALKLNKEGKGYGVIWINPFIKGEGILIQKDYDIEVENEEVEDGDS